LPGSRTRSMAALLSRRQPPNRSVILMVADLLLSRLVILMVEPSTAPTRPAVTMEATVTADAVACADLLLAPTAVTGNVSADQPLTPLAMARARMLDSGEVTFTAADGSFTLSPVEPGAARVIEFSARGYITVTQTVMLRPGQTTTAPAITLLHS